MANKLTDKLPPKIFPSKGAKTTAPKSTGLPEGAPAAMLHEKLMHDAQDKDLTPFALMGGKEPPEPASSGVDYKMGLSSGSKNLSDACAHLKKC